MSYNWSNNYICSYYPNVLPSSTTTNYTFTTSGDTIRICQNRSPASSSTGYLGEICIDANYIYVCTAPNTWSRAVLTGGY